MATHNSALWSVKHPCIYVYTRTIYSHIFISHGKRGKVRNKNNFVSILVIVIISYEFEIRKMGTAFKDLRLQ